MGARTAKRLLILVAVIVTLGLGAYFGRSFQVSRMAKSLVSQAEQAEREGDKLVGEELTDEELKTKRESYAKAAEFYKQHLVVVPDDDDVKAKYADALLKSEDSATFQTEAMMLYSSILEKKPNLNDIRRKLAVLAVGKQAFDLARTHLDILLKKLNKTQVDTELSFLMGQCQESSGNFKEAEKAYRDALKEDPSKEDVSKKLPNRIDISARLAGLLRYRLNQPADGDRVIEEMLKSHPNDYQALLARGRYRLAYDLTQAEADFQKARQAKPDEPDSYIELARLAEQKALAAQRADGDSKQFFNAARTFLEDGLKNTKNKIGIYRALGELGQLSNELDRAIADTRKGIVDYPEQFELRWLLANMMIVKQDDEGLLEQVEELKRRNIIPALTDFLTANHHILKRDFSRAQILLSRIQGDLERFPTLKARAYELIARCDGELNDSNSQMDALRRAVAADPTNVKAKLELVQKLVSRAQYPQAIKEYSKLLKDVPEVWNPLARLMIFQALNDRTRQNWGQIEALIDQAANKDTTSGAPAAMRAELLLAQAKLDDARIVLEQAQKQFPTSVPVWTSLIGLTAFQLDNPLGALKLLESAFKALGDRVELRLEKARILTKTEKNSEALSKALTALGDNVAAFKPAELRKLYEGLANEALRAQAFAPKDDDRLIAVAFDMYTRCAKEDPKNLILHWKLLSLAFLQKIGKGSEDQIKEEKDKRNKVIEEQIQAVKEIEGGDHLMASYAEVWYLGWQADQLAIDSDEAFAKALADKANRLQEAAKKRRVEARSKVDEIASRRPDWQPIPLAYAKLEEQELKALDKEDQNADEALKKADLADSVKNELVNKKQTNGVKRKEIRESLIKHYVAAIKEGQQDLQVVRQAFQLLIEAERSDEALKILTNLTPAVLETLGPYLKQMSVKFEADKNPEKAIQIARTTVLAKPKDVGEHLFFARLLEFSSRDPEFSRQNPGWREEAEKEYREAAKWAQNLDVPWVYFVQFLINTDQLSKAESVLSEIKAALTKEQLALALGQCQESLAKAYQRRGNQEEAKRRIEEAGQWYLTAEKEVPADQPLVRQKVRQLMVSFLLSTNRLTEAQTRLRSALQNADKKSPSDIAWARQFLALSLLTPTGDKEKDKAQAQQALDLFKDRQKTVTKPEDRRAFVKVLLAQGDKEHTAEAIKECLQLVESKDSTPADRFLLTQIYRQSGDWPKAQEQYEALLVMEGQQTNEELLSRYATDLIARIGSSSAEDAAKAKTKAQEIIDRMTKLDPNWMNNLRNQPYMSAFMLQTELFKATGQVDDAVKLIKQAAESPKAQLGMLGLLSERFGQPELAESLLRRWADNAKTSTPAAVLDVAAFLTRNDRYKEALDICEKAEAEGLEPELVARAGVNALFASKGDQAQLIEQANRVSDLIEKGVKAKPKSSMLMVALGNVRERQERYEEAIDYYRRGIEMGARDGVPLNNLAWLTALRGGQEKTAIDMINRAIEINGPIPDFLDTRGMVYLVAGESSRAIEDLEKAVKADPSPSKLVHLAQAYSKAGKKEQAKQNLEKAKNKGFEPKDLHPLELDTYRRFLSELGAT